MQALLTGKTVYETGPWLCDNRPPAEKLMADTYRRLNTALQLASGISQQVATITKEVCVSLLTLPRIIFDKMLIDFPGYFDFRRTDSFSRQADPYSISAKFLDAEFLNSSFSPVYNWTTTALRIIQQYETNEIDFISAENRQLLLRVITHNLPERMRVLRNQPVIKHVLDRAQVQQDRH